MLSFPGQFTAQAHPSTDMFTMVGTLNTLLNGVNAGLSAKGLGTLTEQTFFVGVPKNDVEGYNRCITECFETAVQKNLSHFPSDSYTYFSALKYAEKEVLSKKLNSTNIIAITKNIAKILFPEGGGQYRPCPVYIYDALIMPKGRTKEDFITLDKHYQKEENKDVYEIWKKRTRKIVWDAEFAKEKQYSELSPDDLTCIKRIADVAPPAAEVPSLMNELQKAIDSTDDCYTVAGRIHQIVVKAHPFVDCNGRAARILMNVVLMQAGKPPLLIDNDTNYTKAVKGNKFVEYIQDLANRQPQCERVVALALRFLFDGTGE